MKIAIIYICTGQYEVFWDSFYSTCEQFFYPDCTKTYFVFTDSQRIIRQGKDNESIKVLFQRKAGWPYDTLLRFNSFCVIQDKLLEYDLCYFWNANTVFLKKITEDDIPFPNQEKQLIFWRHTTTYEDEYGLKFDPERNPLSQAFIPNGTKCHPFGGGFFGGKSSAFINMSIILRDRIAMDLENGIIAIWHDQSHLIKYANEVAYLEVPRDYIASEEYRQGRDLYAMFVNKDHYGGSEKMRDLPLKHRLKNRIIKSMVLVSHKTGLIKIYKRIMRKA